MAKIISPAIQQAIREVGSCDGERVPAFRLIANLSNHESVLKMLSRAFPGSDEAEIRQVLAKTASLLRDLEQLVYHPPAPAPVAKSAPKKISLLPAVPKVSRKKELRPPQGSAIALTHCDKIKVFVDGGAKGNPGPAGIGVVFTALNEEVLFEQARYIGKATNNVAEYSALISALKTLVDCGRREVYVFSDSELMVKQMTGAYKIKNEGLMPLVREAQALRRKIARFQITYIPREKNKRADELVNLAISQALNAGKM